MIDVAPVPAPIAPVRNDFKTRFTSANASEMGRRPKKRACHQPPPPPTPVQTPVLPDFQAVQRDNLRARLDKVGKLIDEEDDPQALDRLAAAWSKLAEQERILDGRPLPGSRRPMADRAAKRGPLPEPE